MKKVALYLYLLLIYCACDAPASKAPFAGDPQFRTTDPSRLYFRNIRSASYFHERRPNKMDVYRLRQFSNTKQRPIIYPVIINNWLEDEAYVFVEPNHFTNFHDTLTIQAKSDTGQTEYALLVPNKKMQFDFAQQIYYNIKAGDELSIKVKNGTFIPIFSEKEDRQHYMTTLRDYYRLIESL